MQVDQHIGRAARVQQREDGGGLDALHPRPPLPGGRPPELRRLHLSKEPS